MTVLQPRNDKQVENIRTKQLQKHHISHDALYNLHEMAVDMPDFIHTIHTHPDLVCVCGQRALLEELVLLLNSPSGQLLSYDIFQLGDFYVSVLCFRHTLFKEAPVIPAAFLVHERKFEEHHKELFSVCTKLVRSLNHTTCPMVTDEEVAIVNAVAQVIPQVPQLRCWNHIFRAVMAWLRKHGAPCQDISVYLSDIRDLFHLPTEEEYTSKLASMKQRWSAPFSDYYTNHIHPDIQSIAQWAIEPYGVYHPYSGITNNQSESLNHVLKQLQEWRESPLDCMILALNHLQSYYKVEIVRGQHGLGKYHLHPQYRKLVNTQPLPVENEYSPEQIVERIKGNPKETTTKNIAPKPQKPPKALSQRERARRLIEGKKICFEPTLHTFTVIGSEEHPHVVRLFPKESCSCPSTTQCYHILAAKMCIGMESDSQKGKINLTQLRRNVRSRTEKKSGRKRPRPGDCDIIPAPDSEVGTEETEVEPEGERQDPHLEPEGERQDPHLEPEGDTQDPHLEPEGDTQDPHLEPEGDTQDPHLEPEGDTQDPHLEPEGERQDPHLEPEGERQDPHLEPEGETEIQHKREENTTKVYHALPHS